jgi:hypothetical protein
MQTPYKIPNAHKNHIKPTQPPFSNRTNELDDADSTALVVRTAAGSVVITWSKRRGTWTAPGKTGGRHQKMVMFAGRKMVVF